MTTISWFDLSWCLIPICLVSIIYFYWHGKPQDILLASMRMIIQLVAVGYVLVSIFENPSPWISLGIVSVMMCIAAWIAIRPIRHQPGFLIPALIALSTSVSIHLVICLALVLKADSWYQPQLLIPIAGMFFANTMNGISLAAERYQSELLPGMMTGQILSGVSPLVAVRYQIMIMTMILGTSGLGAAIMLWLVSRRQIKTT